MQVFRASSGEAAFAGLLPGAVWPKISRTVCVSRGGSSSKSRASCDPTRLKLCAVIAETAIPKTQNEIHQPQPPCSLPALSWAAGSWSHLDRGERTSGCPQVARNQCQDAFIQNRALDHSLDAVTSARDPPCKEGVLEEKLRQ